MKSANNIRGIALFLGLCGIGLLAGCTAQDKFIQALLPRHFFYSQNEIQNKLNEKWRYEKKVLGGLFEVKIDAPAVTLLPASNRLKCAFNMTMRRPFSTSVARGTVLVSGILKFDNATRTINLVETEVDAIKSDGFGVNDPALRAISALFGGTLTDIKLYELKPEDLRYAGVTFDPVNFEVKPDGVRVELKPRADQPAPETAL